MGSRKNRRIDSLQQEINHLDMTIRSAMQRRRQLQGQLELAVRDRDLRRHEEGNVRCKCVWCAYFRQQASRKP